MPNKVPYLLNVDGIVSGYGKKQVLNSVTLGVHPGEVVALIGHNGAGKSTLLKAIFGLLSIWEGRIYLDGQTLERPNPRKMLRLGVAYVPQGNRVFTDLSVRENLEITSVILNDKQHIQAGIERVLTLFPWLKSRLRQRAGTLSGGEKQMLALGNALILSPRLLLLDEPSLGLAPPLVTGALKRISEISRGSATAVFVVEQKVREVLKIAQRVYVLRTGQVSFTGPSEELFDDRRLREVYL